MATMLQPLSDTCGRNSLFSSRILRPNRERLHTEVAFHDVMKQKFITENSFTVNTDMMRITTMSHASAAATGRTGPSLQVRLTQQRFV